MTEENVEFDWNLEMISSKHPYLKSQIEILLKLNRTKNQNNHQKGRKS